MRYATARENGSNKEEETIWATYRVKMCSAYKSWQVYLLYMRPQTCTL